MYKLPSRSLYNKDIQGAVPRERHFYMDRKILPPQEVQKLIPEKLNRIPTPKKTRRISRMLHDLTDLQILPTVKKKQFSQQSINMWGHIKLEEDGVIPTKKQFSLDTNDIEGANSSPPQIIRTKEKAKKLRSLFSQYESIELPQIEEYQQRKHKNQTSQEISNYKQGNQQNIQSDLNHDKNRINDEKKQQLSKISQKFWENIEKKDTLLNQSKNSQMQDYQTRNQNNQFQTLNPSQPIPQLYYQQTINTSKSMPQKQGYNSLGAQNENFQSLLNSQDEKQSYPFVGNIPYQVRPFHLITSKNNNQDNQMQNKSFDFQNEFSSIEQDQLNKSIYQINERQAKSALNRKQQLIKLNKIQQKDNQTPLQLQLKRFTPTFMSYNSVIKQSSFNEFMND